MPRSRELRCKSKVCRTNLDAETYAANLRYLQAITKRTKYENQDSGKIQGSFQ